MMNIQEIIIIIFKMYLRILCKASIARVLNWKSAPSPYPLSHLKLGRSMKPNKPLFYCFL